MPDHSNDTTARDQLLKLARDLPYLANAESKPVSVVLAEAKAKLQAIEDSLGGERQPFQRITAAELATGKFDLTYLIDGVLVKDQPAGLVARSSFAHWWSPLGSSEFHPAQIGHASRPRLDDGIERSALKGRDKSAWGRATNGSAAPGDRVPACRALKGRNRF